MFSFKKRRRNDFPKPVQPLSTARYLSNRPVAPLPTEVLACIFDHLQDDRVTLARCMRVSTAANAIAARLLYRHVTWEKRDNFPLALTDNPVLSLTIERRSATKVENLNRIKVLQVAYGHEYCDCDQSASYTEGGCEPIRVAVLRETVIRLPPGCPTLSNIHPTKLVQAALYDRAGKRHIKPAPWNCSSEIKIHTIIFNCRKPLPARTQSELDQLPVLRKRHLEVSHQPQHFFILRDIHHIDVEIETLLGYIISLLPNLPDPEADPGIEPLPWPVVTIVNIEIYDHDLMSEESDADDSGIRMVLMDYAKGGNGLGGLDLRFVTKEEYIRDYDWTGEFTTAEIKEWLAREDEVAARPNHERC